MLKGLGPQLLASMDDFEKDFEFIEEPLSLGGDGFAQRLAGKTQFANQVG